MKLSVIIPVYNVASFLRPCLDSIQVAAARVMCEVELICVDDGSSDGSECILDGYASEAVPNGNVTVLVDHMKNSGVSAARNRGLEMASGDWFLFVDADDFVRNTWLQDVLGMIDRNQDADLIGFGKLPYYGYGEWGDDAVAERDVDVANTIDNVLACFCVYQFAYEASRFKGIRFLPLSVGEDLVFVSEALSLAQKCVISSRREYGYRYREGSASHEDISPSKMLDIIAFNRAMFKTLVGSGKHLGDAFSQGRGREWFYTLPKIILSHRHDAAWRSVMTAWFDSMRDFAALPCFPNWQRRHAKKIASSCTVMALWRHCCVLAWMRRMKII